MSSEPGWLTIDCENERRFVRLDLGLTTLGRNEGNVVDLPDRRLSRYHCEIERKDEGYILRDCGSRNGTKINGIRIAAPVTLADGDKVEIGATSMAFSATRPTESGNRDVVVPLPKILAGRKGGGSGPTRALDLSGATPEEPFDPRPTAPMARPFTGEKEKEKEREKPASRSVVARLARAIELLAEVTTADQVLARLVAEALELVPARQALVLFPGAEPGAAPRVAAQRPILAAGESPAPRFSSGLVEETLRRGKASAIDDLKKDYRFENDVSVLGFNLKGAIAVPLRSQGKARAVLYLDEPQVSPEGREEGLFALQALGDSVAVTLEGGSRLRSVSGDPRARGEAARLTRITAAALAGSQADLAVRLVPGRGAFFEIDESGKPAPGGRSELVLLVALAQLDEGQRLEAATRAAFRALARTTTGAQALALALEEALGTELLGRTLPAAVLRLDTRLCELKVATAGLGPLFLRRAGGEVTSASGVGPALGSGTAAAGVVERAVAWNPGDLVLLTAPRAVSYGAAPWLTGTAGLGASATLERLFADAATAPPSPDNVGGAIALEWTRPAATSWQA